jgi:S-layer homology domain
VQQGNTFYSYVQCLACRGIINGYPDGTFRPGNNVTRGQLAKIVSNSAGFQDVQTVQLFTDVQPGSAFFDFVGRLASRGYMSGYPCGGAGEPCGVDRLPYFRPGNNSTRGQIAKIVANAAGFQDAQPAQLFEDVPLDQPFHDFIGRLASRGYMNGYPCGGAGEPCGTGNLPYFRPGSNATRGQTSKIVANTFFPDCQAVR